MIQTNPVRVLNVLGTTNLGGAESRVMELYRVLDRTKEIGRASCRERVSA